MLLTPGAMSPAPSMPLPSLKDVGVLTPLWHPCHNDNDNTTTLTTTTTMPCYWPSPMVECHVSKKEGMKRGLGMRRSGATWGGKIPTAALTMPTSYSTPAQGSAFAIAAPVVPVSTMGQYVVKAGQCEIHMLPPLNSLWVILYMAVLLMGGSMTSTCHPLQTHFGIIPSVVALSMGGSVNIHTPPPQTHFGIIASAVALSTRGSVNIHMLPPWTHFG